MEYENYKDLALKIINNSRLVLEKHRGCKQIFGNLIALILTAGIAFPVNKAICGHFLFFKQTDCIKQLEALNLTINTYLLQIILKEFYELFMLPSNLCG